MDVDRVDQIARQHKELATNGGPGTLLETDTARRHEAEALNRLFREDRDRMRGLLHVLQ